jgi:hypothetical protein
MTPERARLLFGTDEPVAAPLALRCGAIQAQLRGTRLGPVLVDGHEAWHGIDFLYRDPDWGTPAPVVDHVEHRGDPSSFSVRLRGHIPAAARIDFEIAIDAEGSSLHYAVQAIALGDLATNRTGVVLMHPLSACGRCVEVEHVDGRVSASTFPTQVAPWPPFMLVRAIRHEFGDGGWASCRLEGDVFELEDQRNNADASFKTYSRSNMMPRPYLLRAGMGLSQSVRLKVEARPRAGAAPTLERVSVQIGPATGALPLVGVAIAPSDVHAGPEVRDALRRLSPALLHLVVDGPNEQVDAVPLARLLEAAGGPCLRVDIGAGAPLTQLAASLRDAGIVPAQVAVFPSTPPSVDAARRAFPDSAVGGGTPHFFTQLNRAEDLGRVEFLSFTTSSVVHGADDEDIMAGLQSLPSMVETLRARHGDLPVHVGPSSIGARRSPLGGQPASDGTRRMALARRDPRTHARFGAAWALGYVARFAAAGVRAVTLFDLQGDAALFHQGQPTPAFELLRHLMEAASLHEVRCSAPDRLAVLALQRRGMTECLLGNLTGEPLAVQLQRHGGADTELTLAPYEVAVL